MPVSRNRSAQTVLKQAGAQAWLERGEATVRKQAAKARGFSSSKRAFMTTLPTRCWQAPRKS
jgi:hypothetical protein